LSGDNADFLSKNLGKPLGQIAFCDGGVEGGAFGHDAVV
jgi:hypothetical protein